MLLTLLELHLGMTLLELNPDFLLLVRKGQLQEKGVAYLGGTGQLVSITIDLTTPNDGLDVVNGAGLMSTSAWQADGDDLWKEIVS